MITTVSHLKQQSVNAVYKMLQIGNMLFNQNS